MVPSCSPFPDLPLLSGHRVLELHLGNLPQLVEGTGPLVAALVAGLEVSDDGDDELVGVDVLVGDLLDPGLGHSSDVVAERLGTRS